jgi:hypothetical protein
MKLTKEEGRDIVWNDHEDWEEIESETDGNNRWSIFHTGVFKHKPSGKFYSLNWSVGATETQDQQAFEYEDPKPVEVKQVEKVVKVWECV